MPSIVRDALGIGVATGAYGLSFGALAVAAGLTVPQACALSLLMFTGASQFAFVGLIGGGAVAAVGTALLLGARRAYGLPLAPYLRPRPVAAQLLIDESAAMAVGRETATETRLGFWATGAAVFVCWNLETLLGALAGDLLEDPRALGLDAAAPAAFLALLAPRLDTREPRVVAALAAGPHCSSCPSSDPASPCSWPPRSRRMWTPILIAAGGCYALKLAGLSVPRRVLDGPRARRVALLLPVALLAALIATQSAGGLDARAAGLAPRPSSRSSCARRFSSSWPPPRPRPRSYGSSRKGTSGARTRRVTRARHGCCGSRPRRARPRRRGVTWPAEPRARGSTR